jgi:hypothetical protein
MVLAGSVGVRGGSNLSGFGAGATWAADPLGLACPHDARTAWILYALRERGTPEALAIAALIKRGDMQIEYRTRSASRPTILGEAPWGQSKVILYTDNIKSASHPAYSTVPDDLPPTYK